MIQLSSTTIRRQFALAIIISIILGAGCAVKFVSDYDPKTDAAVTDLNREVERFLIFLQRTIATDEAKYEKHTGFYDETKANISSLKLRASLKSKNNITMQQLELVGENLDLLEEMHQMGFSSAEELDPIRSAFNTSFKAILKFEFAKKRGK